MSTDQGSKVYRIGKDTIAFEYPEIYFQFVSLLQREHSDLLRAMSLAEVRRDDFTAITFLNNILNVNVTQDMPMDVGYQILYDALQRRSRSPLSSSVALALAERETKSEDSPKLTQAEMFPITPEEKRNEHS